MDLVSITIAILAALIVVAIIVKNQDRSVEAPGAKRIGQESPSKPSRLPRIVDDDEFVPISDSDLESRVRSLVLARQNIEAIKLIRLQKEIGLKEAKDVVDELARSGNYTLRTALGAEMPAPPHHALPETIVQVGQDERIIALLRRGQKIEAIKEYRDQTGLGLKEAKDQIDELARKHGI